jgi:hypothetical protein
MMLCSPGTHGLLAVAERTQLRLHEPNCILLLCSGASSHAEIQERAAM